MRSKRAHLTVLCEDVRSTVLLHGGLLHELRDLYKHLRVELKVMGPADLGG